MTLNEKLNKYKMETGKIKDKIEKKLFLITMISTIILMLVPYSLWFFPNYISPISYVLYPLSVFGINIFNELLRRKL